MTGQEQRSQKKNREVSGTWNRVELIEEIRNGKLGAEKLEEELRSIIEDQIRLEFDKYWKHIYADDIESNQSD